MKYSGANSRYDELLHVSVREGDPPDYCSQAGAMALKARIEAYWRERGHDVMLSLHNVGFHPAIRAARFDVRSDMVNGMPRGAPQPQSRPVEVSAAADTGYAFDDELEDEDDLELEEALA